MISRDAAGRMQVRRLDMAVFFDNLFMECKTEREIEFLQETIEGLIEQSADDTLMSIIGDGGA